jgi:hypothetical protein
MYPNKYDMGSKSIISTHCTVDSKKISCSSTPLVGLEIKGPGRGGAMTETSMDAVLDPKVAVKVNVESM